MIKVLSVPRQPLPCHEMLCRYRLFCCWTLGDHKARLWVPWVPCMGNFAITPTCSRLSL